MTLGFQVDHSVMKHVNLSVTILARMQDVFFGMQLTRFLGTSLRLSLTFMLKINGAIRRPRKK